MSRKATGKQLVIASVAAIFIVGVLIAVSRSGGDGKGLAGGAEAAAIFAGIPQDGRLLGRRSADVTMSEFADLQCPFCARYARDALPELVRRYVRPGRVRMELNFVRFLGPDSDPAARAAVAASLQDKMWEFAEVFYANQGAENSGYVDEAFIRDVAEAVPGLDADRLMRDRGAPLVEREIAANEYRARPLEVTSTPTFFLARHGRTPRRLTFTSLEADAFAPALERLTGG
jgi:protein-disulfide isomerase